MMLFCILFDYNCTYIMVMESHYSNGSYVIHVLLAIAGWKEILLLNDGSVKWACSGNDGWGSDDWALGNGWSGKDG